MAINVRTWDEFKTAWTTAAASETIEILADIDVNDDPPSGDLARSGELTINGNNHKINNIQAAGTDFQAALFRQAGNADTNWNSVNFVNIDFASTVPIFYAYNSSFPHKFNQCTFQGQSNGKLVNNGSFYRCAITWKTVQPVDGVFAGSGLSYTWCHVESFRATTNLINDFDTLSSSYIEGRIDGHDDSVTSAGNIAGTMTNSCINLTTSLTRVTLAGSQPALCCVYNTDKLSGYSGIMTNVVGVTDAQMKSAQDLYDKGFDIIV